MAGDHAGADAASDKCRAPRAPLSVPFAPPFSLINALSLRAFNFAYYHKPLPAHALVHYAPFFYPLDGIAHWNRLYGRQGFFQYQFVVPLNERAALDEIFATIARSGK